MTTVISHSIAGTGHYKSNHGFVNDANGADPYRWTVSEAGGTVGIIASSTTHNKVLELHDTSGAALVSAKTPDFDQGYGTIEYWYKTSKIADTHNFLYAYSEDDTMLLRLSTLSTGGITGWYYYNGGGNVKITGFPDPAVDTWYRVRIDFECTAGGYLGLAQYTWKLTVDGTAQTSADQGFLANKPEFHYLTFETHAAHNTYYDYIEALGFSWDGNYTIGDNATEYTSVVYKHAKARRGTHESHHDFSAFDITKMSFPSQI